MKWEMNYGAKLALWWGLGLVNIVLAVYGIYGGGTHPGEVSEESGPGLDFFVGHTTCPFIVYWSLALLAQVASLRLDYS